MAWCFITFLSVVLSKTMCMSTYRLSSSPSNTFFHVIYQFSLSVMLFLFSYLAPETVLFSLHSVLHLSLYFLCWLIGRIFFHYFERSCFVCSSWVCPGIFWFSIANTVGFTSSCCLVCCYLFSVFSFHCVLVYILFLTTFVCSWSFFIFLSCLISHPGFVFLFGFPTGNTSLITD